MTNDGESYNIVLGSPNGESISTRYDACAQVRLRVKAKDIIPNSRKRVKERNGLWSRFGVITPLSLKVIENHVSNDVLLHHH